MPQPHDGLRSIGARATDLAAPDADDDIPPDELLGYVDTRLQQEAAAAEERARAANVRGLPGDRERNIAITHLQTARLWLAASRQATPRT